MVATPYSAPLLQPAAVVVAAAITIQMVLRVALVAARGIQGQAAQEIPLALLLRKEITVVRLEQAAYLALVGVVVLAVAAEMAHLLRPEMAAQEQRQVFLEGLLLTLAAGLAQITTHQPQARQPAVVELETTLARLVRAAQRAPLTLVVVVEPVVLAAPAS